MTLKVANRITNIQYITLKDGRNDNKMKRMNEMFRVRSS